MRESAPRATTPQVSKTQGDTERAGALDGRSWTRHSSDSRLWLEDARAFLATATVAEAEGLRKGRSRSGVPGLKHMLTCHGEHTMETRHDSAQYREPTWDVLRAHHVSPHISQHMRYAPGRSIVAHANVAYLCALRFMTCEGAYIYASS